MPDLGVLRPPARILFGEGAAKRVGSLSAEFGGRVLLCTDSYLASADQGTQILAALRSAGCSVEVLDSAQPELPLGILRSAIVEARRFDVDCIVGLGGGSCLDFAKLIALGLSDERDLQGFYGENLVAAPVLPLVALPTTAGTGSEVTPVAVLSDPSLALKVGISSPYLIPRVAICDPELTRGAPASVTAYAGIDALAHAIEAFTAIQRDSLSDTGERVFVGANVLSDRFALQAVRKLTGALEAAISDEPWARADALQGSLCAGLAFASAGTALAHALQYPLGARTRTAHGLGVGLLLPYVMAFNCSVRSTRMAEIAEAMGVGSDPVAAAYKARALGHAIGLPDSLCDIGVIEADLDVMASQAIGIERLIANNPREVSHADARMVLAGAMTGDLDSCFDH